MNHLIGQRQIADGIVILVAVEVIGIPIERFTETMAIIEHRSDSIEAEPVEVELF